MTTSTNNANKVNKNTLSDLKKKKNNEKCNSTKPLTSALSPHTLLAPVTRGHYHPQGSNKKDRIKAINYIKLINIPNNNYIQSKQLLSKASVNKQQLHG